MSQKLSLLDRFFLRSSVSRSAFTRALSNVTPGHFVSSMFFDASGSKLERSKEDHLRFRYEAVRLFEAQRRLTLFNWRVFKAEGYNDMLGFVCVTSRYSTELLMTICPLSNSLQELVVSCCSCFTSPLTRTIADHYSSINQKKTSIPIPSSANSFRTSEPRSNADRSSL